jgi:Ca2+-dependent lipid-binding protein
MASLQSAADSHPTLQFSLYYDIQRRVLAVHIQQAYNLPVISKGTVTHPCSPFIVLYLLPNKQEVFESRVIHRDLNPYFNQIFDFPSLLPEDIRKQTLVMKVFHSRRTKHELIGMISVSLEDADLYGVSMKMSIDEKVEHFSSESRGQVLVSLTHIPDTGLLQGIVLRAKNLQKVNGSGTACPYIKVYQLHNGKRQHKWKTSVKRNTLMPIFNEPFRFEIASTDLHSFSLDILIMDHNRFSGDETMGIIRVGDSAPEETGRSHWSEVIRTPRQAVSRWHTAWPVTHVYDSSSDRESIVTN